MRYETELTIKKSKRAESPKFGGVHGGEDGGLEELGSASFGKKGGLKIEDIQDQIFMEKDHQPALRPNFEL